LTRTDRRRSSAITAVPTKPLPPVTNTRLPLLAIDSGPSLCFRAGSVRASATPGKPADRLSPISPLTAPDPNNFVKKSTPNVLETALNAVVAVDFC
jgi:hypothetical protein